MPDTLQTSIELYDKVTAPTKNMVNALSKMLDVFKSLDSSIAGGLDTSALTSAERELNAIKATMAQTEQSAGQVSDEWNKMGDAVKQASVDTNALIGSLNGAAAAANNLREPLTGLERINRMNELSRLFREAGQGAAEAATHVTAYASRLDKCNVEAAQLKSTLERMRSVQPLSGISADIEEFDIRVSLLKSKLSNLFSAIKPSNAFKQVSNQVLQLQWNISSAMHSMKQFASTKLSNLKSGLTGIKNTLTQGQTGAKGFVTALKNIGKISVTSLVNGVKNVGTQLKNGVSKAKEFASSLKQAASVTFNKLASGIKSAGSALGSAALSGAKVAAGALAAGTAAVGGLIAKGISYNNQMEQYQTSFTTLLEGNQAAADGLVSSLKEMADTTPFEMTDMSSAAQTLLGFGVAADKVMPSLQALGDVSQGNSERFSNLSLAFAQVQAAGKLTGQDLLQFVNAGFNPLQEMSRTTGKSLAELREEMSEGAISAEMVADAFQSATSEGGRFYQSMQKQSKTFSGQMSTIKDNVNSMLGTLTSGLQQDLAANFLPQINESLSSLNAAFTSGGMEGFLNALPTAIDGIMSAITTKLQTGLPTIINIVVSALNSIVNSIAGYLPSLVSTIGNGLLQLLQGLLNTLQSSGPQLISGLVDSLSQFVTGLLGMLPQIANVGMSLIISLVQGIAQAAPTLIPAAVDAVMNFTNNIYNNIGSIITAGLQLVSGLVQGIVTAIPRLVSAIPNLITSFINSITSNLPAIIEMGAQILVQLVFGLMTTIPKLLTAIPKIVKALWDGLTSINWLDLGKNILSSIGDGIKSGLKGLFGIGEDGGEAVVEGYESGSSGISSSAINSGLEAAQGFSSGITSNMGLATGAASDMSQNAASAFGSGSLLSNLEGADMTSDFAAGITGSSYAAESAAGGVSLDTANAFGDYSSLTNAAGTDMTSGFASGINASGQTPVQEAQSISANVQTALDNASASINNFMVQLTNTLTNAKSNISLWVSELSAEIQNGLKFDGTNGVITNFMIGLTNTLTSAKTNIVLWFSEIAAEVQAKTDAMISALQGFQTSLYNTDPALSSLTSAVTQMEDVVKRGMDTVAKTASQKMKEFVQAISDGGTQTKTKLSEIKTNIETAFTTINLRDTGKNIIQGLIDGIDSKRSDAIAAARDIADAIRDTIDSAMGIASPSKLMMEKGRYITEGLAIGMTNRLRDVKRAALSLSSAAGEYPKTTFGNRDTVTARGDYSDIRSAAGKSDRGETKTIVKAPITITINNDNEISSEMDLTDVIKRMSNGIYANLQSNLEANYGV